MHPKGILVTGEEKSIGLLTLGTCSSRFVAIAIGGGGKGGAGGGGSGYVNHRTNSLPQKAYIKMAVHVHPGNSEEDSFVRDLATNRDIVRGRRGQNGGAEWRSSNGGAGE